MKVVHFVRPGGPGLLRIIDVPMPTVGSFEILIHVTAVGLNIYDTWRRSGNPFYFYDYSPFLGYECSGKVAFVGSDVSKFKVGDEVCAVLDGGGGYAEFVAVHENLVLRIPSNVSLAHAAALPQASCLTFYALSILTNIDRGKTILIHGAAGDIGIIALQYAKHVGCEVFAAAETEEKLRHCKTLGAEVCINYKKEDFCKRVKAETGEKGVDIVLDVSGRSHFQKNLDCLAVGGSLVILGFKRGSTVNIDFSVLMKKDINVIAGDLENLGGPRMGSLFSEAGAKFWPLIEDGHMKPIIGEVFRFSEAAEAHTALEGCAIAGKILLVPYKRSED